MRSVVSKLLGIAVLLLMGSLPQPLRAQTGTLADPIDLAQIDTVEGNMDCDYEVADCYSYHVALSESDKGYHLVPKNWLAAFDPQAKPDNLDDNSLATFATPGEYEPVTFVIYAQEPLQSIDVSVSDLTAEGGATLASDQVQVRTVRRAFKRLSYAQFREDKYNKAIIADRYVPAYEPVDLGQQQFREIWLSMNVPKDAKAGTYTGEVTVQPEGKPASTLDLSLEVLPFALKEDPDNQFGIYYRMYWRFPPGAPTTVRERALAELRDMRAHGVNMIASTGLSIRARDDSLVAGVGVHFSQNRAGTITWNFASIRNFIDLAKQAGFEKLRLVVNSGLKHLAALRGHGSLDRRGPDEMTPEEFAQAAEAIEDDEQLFEAAEQALADLKELQNENSQFELILTHMDEVLNQGQLPAYLALSKAVRQASSSWPLYITLRTSYPREDSLRTEVLDPYVDIRSYNGASFEQWLVRNDNPIEKHRQELATSGDEAWTYHNEKGYWMNPEANRVITGLYLWNTPLNGRADWNYHFRWLLPVGWNDNLPFHELDERDRGLAFPSREDYETPVPSKNWQAEREGYDDLRYLYTLQQAIQRADGTELAQEAQDWLDSVENGFAIHPDNLPEERSEYRGGTGLFATPEESPITQAAAERHPIGDYQQLRRQAADYTVRLMETNTARGDDNAVPRDYVLSPNYPNPFNPATTIRYTLPQAQHARLTIYNALGQQVAMLVDGRQPAGQRTVRWEAADRASGVYFYRLEAGNFTQTRAMMLVK